METAGVRGPWEQGRRLHESTSREPPPAHDTEGSLLIATTPRSVSRAVPQKPPVCGAVCGSCLRPHTQHRARRERLHTEPRMGRLSGPAWTRKAGATQQTGPLARPGKGLRGRSHTGSRTGTRQRTLRAPGRCQAACRCLLGWCSLWGLPARWAGACGRVGTGSARFLGLYSGEEQVLCLRLGFREFPEAGFLEVAQFCWNPVFVWNGALPGGKDETQRMPGLHLRVKSSFPPRGRSSRAAVSSGLWQGPGTEAQTPGRFPSQRSLPLPLARIRTTKTSPASAPATARRGV